MFTVQEKKEIEEFKFTILYNKCFINLYFTNEVNFEKMNLTG